MSLPQAKDTLNTLSAELPPSTELEKALRATQPGTFLTKQVTTPTITTEPAVLRVGTEVTTPSEKKLRALMEDFDTLQKELMNIKSQMKEVFLENGKKDADIAELSRKLTTLKEELGNSQSELDKKNEEIEKLKKELEKQREVKTETTSQIIRPAIFSRLPNLTNSQTSELKEETVTAKTEPQPVSPQTDASVNKAEQATPPQELLLETTPVEIPDENPTIKNTQADEFVSIFPPIKPVAINENPTTLVTQTETMKDIGTTESAVEPAPEENKIEISKIDTNSTSVQPLNQTATETVAPEISNNLDTPRQEPTEQIQTPAKVGESIDHQLTEEPSAQDLLDQSARVDMLLEKIYGGESANDPKFDNTDALVKKLTTPFKLTA